MKPLHPSDFAAFSSAVHGHDPFPWQLRLIETLASEGTWPEVLDLPTGAGKTTAIDLALFHLALEAGRPDRRAPLRIVLVVDRRTIVDQAHERAEKIRRALEAAADGVLTSVRDRLASYSRDGRPVHVALMRGGIVRDDAWARTPDQPTIALSTVDQVGSRLLFRGYGVSDSMKPVHAGLLGNDTLLLLDEVHLAEPFCESLVEIARFRQSPWMQRELPDRWQFVRMSATTLHRKGAFCLAKEDESHPVLSRRLVAAKPVELREIRVAGHEDARARTYALELARTAVEHAAPGSAVAVVVNRIATAHLVHGEVGRLGGEALDVRLLTGRMRPRERTDLERALRPRIAAGREREPQARPVVLVSTQCIEAGADYDFDVLITDCASLDALRQRFGRLNRLGEAMACRGFVFIRSDILASEDDPIYGQALAATWTYLRGMESVDFGLRRLDLPEGEDLARLVAATGEAPLLLPAYLDAWVQTAPRPEPDPDPSLWLHGKERQSEPEVQVSWRADLDPESLLAAVQDDEMEGDLIAVVSACPPSAGELVSVTRSALRRWLERMPADPLLSDVEGAATEQSSEADAPGGAAERRPFLVWRGEDDSRVMEGAGDLRPGETIVVPAAYGGLRDGNWYPASGSAVRDIATRAHLEHRGRLVWRLHPEVVADELCGDTKELPEALVPPLPENDSDQSDDLERIAAWLERIRDRAETPEDVRQLAAALAGPLQRRARILRVRSGPKQWFVLVARAKTSGFATSEEDHGSFIGTIVPLSDHLGAVGERARAYAEAVGLPPDVVADVSLAGQLHDLGKADRRFQQMLHGGSAFKASVSPTLIAKSAMPQNDRSAREAARKRSGYPRGARHELQSVALVQGVEEIAARASDWDLVLHLVAAHHGYCRPLAPAVPDDGVSVKVDMGDVRLHASSAHELHRLDSGVAERFWTLVRRYGWFQLAWLEALVRLADHRRSEEEQRGST